MAWIRSRKKQSGGGGATVDKVIDWELYSHPSAFDSIPLPANYTDYDHLALMIIQSTSSQDFNEGMAIAEVEQFINTGVRGTQILIIDTADITPNNKDISIPMMSGDTFGMGTYTYGATKINSSSITGYDYAWSWQNLYLLALGFND